MVKTPKEEWLAIASLVKDFLIDGRRSLIWEVRLGGALVSLVLVHRATQVSK